MKLCDIKNRLEFLVEIGRSYFQNCLWESSERNEEELLEWARKVYFESKEKTELDELFEKFTSEIKKHEGKHCGTLEILMREEFFNLACWIHNEYRKLNFMYSTLMSLIARGTNLRSAAKVVIDATSRIFIPNRK